MKSVKEMNEQERLRLFRVILTTMVLQATVACVGTPERRELDYWKARGAWVATQEAYNEFLEYDNGRVRRGEEPLLNEQGRRVGLEITREAMVLFDELQYKVQDESYIEEVMLGIGRGTSLTMRLAALYTEAQSRDSEEK